jgi:hypothetical protein
MDYLAAANWWVAYWIRISLLRKAVKGNNLLLEEYETPQKTIPLKWLHSAYRYDNHPFIWWVSRS